MTIIRLPYVQQFKDRHGKARAYFRRPGCERIRLPGIPGSKEFMDAYQQAMATSAKESTVSDEAGPDSVSAMISAYFRSPDFLDRASSTKANHRAILERFRNLHGKKKISSLTETHVRAILEEKTTTPAAANHLLNCMRKICRIALRRGLLKKNPTDGIEKRKYEEAPFATWTDDQIATFERRWPVNTRARLALALLLFTAQRRSDVVRLGPQNIRRNMLEFTQVKTKVAMAIPIHRELRAVIDQHPTNHLAFLTTAYGKPMTSAGFTQWFMECVIKAGLPPTCKPHGLRKAALTRLAEQGCSAHQIMAISGHSTLSEVEKYTAAARRRGLARTAMDAMESWKYEA